MSNVRINTNHPKLEISRLFNNTDKSEKAASKAAEDQSQLRFTTESSMEDNNTAAYQKLNARKKGVSKVAPTTENWLG